MPRGKTSQVISSLSFNVPRRIHRATRLRSVQCGSPSMAAYVAWWLSQAPNSITTKQFVELMLIETEIKACHQGQQP